MTVSMQFDECENDALRRCLQMYKVQQLRATARAAAPTGPDCESVSRESESGFLQALAYEY